MTPEGIFWLSILAASCALGLYSWYRICRILYSRLITKPQSKQHYTNPDTNPYGDKNDNSPNLAHEGMSITKIADIINCNKETYYRYEGKYKPMPKVVIISFCHFLAVFPKSCVRVYRRLRGLSTETEENRPLEF